MNDVDMDKLIDLVEMCDNRVNLSIEGIDVQSILKRTDSEHILKKLKNPQKGDELLLIKMIRLGRSTIVKHMIDLDAKTDLTPGVLQSAIESRNY